MTTSSPQTQTNETLRPNVQLIQALEARDAARIQTLLDSRIETRQSAELPWGGTFIGLDGFGQFFASVLKHPDSTVTIQLHLECLYADGALRMPQVEDAAVSSIDARPLVVGQGGRFKCP